MKKLVYTLSFIALLSIAGKAQQAVPVTKQDPDKKSKSLDAKPATKEEKATTGNEPKAGTRMAINEKGVPASRASKEKSKEEKTAAPAATEKK